MRRRSKTAAHELDRSWLVQRLETPWAPRGIDNPFSFGAGGHGGLRPEARDMLRDVFTFDYMGAAEYEFGAVPKALSEINDAAHEGDMRPGLTPVEGGMVYVLCRAEWTEPVIERVREWATGELPETRDPVNLKRALSDPEYRVGGWLELNNPFMFFTDQTMFVKTCDLFEVDRSGI